MRTLEVLFSSLAILIALFGQSSGFAEESQSAKSPYLTSIAPENVRSHVEFLASEELQGRGSGESRRITAEYLKSRYAACGLKPLFAGGRYFQIIAAKPGKDGHMIGRGLNVGALLPGSDPKVRDELIIVSAHYDHLGVLGDKIYPGADDNASGVAMVLETARKFTNSHFHPRRSVAFVNFDLEEKLLWGSRWFVSHSPWPLKQIKLFITADMLGRSLGDLPMENVFLIGSEHAPELLDTISNSAQSVNLRVDRLGVDLIGNRSDYGPFRAKEIPFLFFSSGEHSDYHSPRDTADRVNYQRLAAISTLISRMTQKVADAESIPDWTETPQHDVDDAETLLRILGIVLKADEQGQLKLLGPQRFLLSNVQTKVSEIVTRGHIRPEERPWIVRSAQFLLLTVF